jgi:hypothetical protein
MSSIDDVISENKQAKVIRALGRVKSPFMACHCPALQILKSAKGPRGLNKGLLHFTQFCLAWFRGLKAICGTIKEGPQSSMGTPLDSLKLSGPLLGFPLPLITLFIPEAPTSTVCPILSSYHLLSPLLCHLSF